MALSALSSIVSQLNSRNRISGISSGLDTDTIIKTMLQATQSKFDKQFRAYQKLDWQRAAYQEQNALMTTFRNDFMSTLNSAKNMTSVYSYKTNKVVYDNNSATNAVNITAGPNAQIGAVMSVQVLSLASGAKYETDAGVNQNNTLAEISHMMRISNGTGMTFTGGELSFKIAGEEFTFKSTDSLKKVMTDVNSRLERFNIKMEFSADKTFVVRRDGAETVFGMGADSGGFFKTMGIEGMSGGHIYASSKPLTHNPVFVGEAISGSTKLSDVAAALNQARGTSMKLGASGKIEFAINGKNFSFNATDTLSTVLETVNKSDAGVKMSFSQVDNSLVVESTGKGTVQQLSISDNSGFFRAFGIFEADNAKAGNYAVVKINGKTSVQESNSFELDGITYKLNRVTETDKPVEFQIAQDIDKAVDNIKAYVDAYNKIIDSINGLITQKPNANYQPLTEEERSQLTEQQIQDWEKLAKSGILRNDSGMQRLLSDLRAQFYSVVGDTGLTLSDIGLNTTSDWKDGGRIAINETVLRKHLEKDPDMVHRLFAAKVDSDKKDENGHAILDMKASGLVWRLSETMYQYTFNNSTVQIGRAESEMIRIDRALSDIASQYKLESDRYYAKFAAMETALAGLQSQSSYITQLLTASFGGK